MVEMEPLPLTAVAKYGIQAERIVSILVMSAGEGVVPALTSRMNAWCQTVVGLTPVKPDGRDPAMAVIWEMDTFCRVPLTVTPTSGELLRILVVPEGFLMKKKLGTSPADRRPIAY